MVINKLVRWYNAVASRFKTSQIVYMFLVNPRSHKGTGYWGQPLERDDVVKRATKENLENVLSQHPTVVNKQSYDDH